MTSEKIITRRIQNWLKSAGWHVVKIHGGGYQAAGLPDLFAIKEGHLAAIEVKTPRGIVSALQSQRLKELEKAGATTIVARSLDDVIAALNGK